MDESKPPVFSGDFRLRSASGRTSPNIDAGAARQGRAGQADVPRSDPSGESPVTVYYRNEEEVREGFLIALRAMDVAVIEPPPEPEKSSVRAAKR